ncbi:uncharacterized protein [Hemitrygon akajei]|uniref:uncharacterized protein n=1 Tax=Hemitrygon akajei TaxID=2704970 RepID=UPI003BF9FCE4
MDDREAYMNKKPIKTGSRSPYRAEPTVSYVEPKVKTLFVPQVRRDGDHQTSTYTELNIRKVERLTNTQADGLDPTYSQLTFRQNELPVAKDEDPPIASRPAAHEQQSKVKIVNRPYRLICLLCLVTSALIVTLAGLSIHVSQIRQSKITSDRNYQLLWEENHEMNRTQRQCRLQVHELNATLQSTISEISHLNQTQRSCLKDRSVLNYNLSVLKRRHTELRQQFTEMETKYRSANETKAQICELLTSRREQTCSKDWIRNECQCYFISSFESFYDWAKQLCSIADSMLLEINSDEEENFINNRVRGQDGSYWIGTCKAGEAASNVEYKVNAGQVECGKCKSPWYRSCNNDEHRFICEKSASLCPDIPLKIRDVCQQPVELT